RVCLMGNHYHLMAETRRANLVRWMHWLTTAYTVYFNRRQGGLIKSEEDLTLSLFYRRGGRATARLTKVPGGRFSSLGTEPAASPRCSSAGGRNFLNRFLSIAFMKA